ncbi:MAG: universal stress protein [Pseudoflavonifractor sp.]|nr:universal stress protein [Pseudoflavonifractor sp.]
MDTDRLITIAIHTYEKAVILKTLLENEGIPVALHNVNLIQPVVSSGVRVRIHEKDLPLALRIIENAEIINIPEPENESQPTPEITVPVDFSPHSTEACKLAFRLADSLSASVKLIHTFIDPYFSTGFQLTETVNYDISENVMRQQLEDDANRRMKNFCASLREGIKSGMLPAVRFTSEVIEGVPEEVIVEQARTTPRTFIVMGTRGAGNKERDLVGSVTAEVLDSCRVPVLTVPEHASYDKIVNIAVYTSLDQTDLIVLDSLHRYFPGRAMTITFIALPSRKISDPTNLLDKLTEYDRTHYPTDDCSSRIISQESLADGTSLPSAHADFDMVVVPNRKKNIFARLFNPGIAHRLLFHADIPILAIPV